MAPMSPRGRVAAREVAPIVAVVYDERYADCRVFAEALARCSAKPFATNQDAARLWYGPLREYLAQYPGRVAGLGTYADFSISQECGRELGLATIFEGEHDARRARTTITHRVRARIGGRELAVRLGLEGWAAQLATALVPMNPFLAEDADRSIVRHSVQETPRSVGYPGYLNSWLLGSAGG